MQRIHIEEAWPRIAPGITQILSSSKEAFPRTRWLELYTLVHDYLTSPFLGNETLSSDMFGPNGKGVSMKGQAIYERIEILVEGHFKQTLEELLQSTIDGRLLKLYGEKWDQFLLGAHRVSRLFDYLNRSWFASEEKNALIRIYDINTFLLVIWERCLHQNIKAILVAEVVSYINKERNGEQIDRSLISTIVTSFVRLGISPDDFKVGSIHLYEQDFEKELLKGTKDYYTLYRNLFIANNSCTDYVMKVEFCLRYEADLAVICFHEKSRKKVIEICEDTLIKEVLDYMCSEFPNLIERNALSEMSVMYQLLSKINKLTPLHLLFEEKMHQDGIDSIVKLGESISDASLFVEGTLSICNYYTHIINMSFQGDQNFFKAMDRALRGFINKNSITRRADCLQPAEMLVSYIDSRLRKSQHVSDEFELDQSITKCMRLFKWIEDKDIFLKAYSKKLAFRLMNDMSVSRDSELMMISRLKIECGIEYITKIQKMYTDMDLNQTLKLDFETYANERGIVHTSDFGVQVLTSNSWPVSPLSTSIHIPSELGEMIFSFESFYSSRFNGRKLTWLHQYSKVDLKASYFVTPKTFVVSTYHMVILLHFNNELLIPSDRLKELTNMSEPVFRGVLESLVDSQILLINKYEGESNGKNVSLNLRYANKRHKINITGIVKAAVTEESQQVEKMVEEDRKVQIEAAIVRVMKSRKKLAHVDLVQEVILQLQSRFNPPVPAVKQHIEKLIEREFLERDSSNPNIYIYLA